MYQRFRICFIFCLVVLALNGCGNSFQDVTSGQTPPTPRGETATVRVDHVLARAVPSSVDTFRFSGTDQQGQPTFGPITRPRASSVTLLNVPVQTRTVLIEYLNQNSAIGRFSAEVSLSSGQTFVITNPAWQDVDSGEPSQLGLRAVPSLAAPLAPLSPALEVSVLDTQGQLVESSSATVTISRASGPGILGGTATAVAVNGIATFSDLTLSLDGTYTLRAESHGLTPVTTDVIQVLSAPSANSLSFTTPPADSTSRLSTVVITVLDQFQNPFTSFQGPITVALGNNPSGGQLTGTVTVNAINGIATFDNLFVTVSGSDYSLVASSPNLVSGTSPTFNIEVGTLYRGRFSLVHPLDFNETWIGKVVHADLDGDGKVETLLGSQSTQNVSVLTQTEDGDIARQELACPGLFLLDSGDVNGDGRPDLVTINESAGLYRLEVRLGQGDGSFASSPMVTPLGANLFAPQDIAVADLNSDGFADVAISAGRNSSPVLVVALSNGSQFVSPTDTSVSAPDGSPAGVAIGHFRNGTTRDIAIGVGTRVHLFDNDGSGHFSSGITTPAGGNAVVVTAVVAADFNGDGLDDLAVTHVGNISNLSVLRNDSGSFTSMGQQALEETKVPIGGLSVADFNNDGTPDIARVWRRTSSNSSSDVCITLIDPANANYLGSSQYIRVGDDLGPIAIQAADLNYDGNVDVGLLRQDGSYFRLNGNGQGRLLPTDSYGDSRLSAIVGDLDGDGRSDLVTSGNGTEVYLREPGGAIPTVPTSSLTLNYNTLALADTNEDGLPDLFGAIGNLVQVHLNAGDGSFSTAFIPITMAGTVQVLALGDLNGDGAPDIVACSQGNSLIYLALSNGSGGYDIAPSLPTSGTCYDVRLADINGDGELDIVTAQGPLGIGVHLNSGGSFTESLVAVPGDSVSAVDTGDLNSDGQIDLAVATAAGVESGKVLTLLNHDGMLAPAGVLTLPGLRSPKEVLIADANGDSVNDILVVDETLFGCAAYIGVGDGIAFSSGSLLFAGGRPNGSRSLALLDINGDGVVEPLFARTVSAGGTLTSFLTLLGLVAASLAVRRRRAP